MKRFLIPIILISCNGYAASIQKWVDESGEVHYGDSPPPATQTQPISVSRPPSNPGKPLPRLTGSQGEDKAASDSSANKKPQNRTTEQASQQVCEKARENLATIQSSTIIRLRQTDGTERVLNDQEIDERRQQFENDVKQYCK